MTEYEGIERDMNSRSRDQSEREGAHKTDTNAKTRRTNARGSDYNHEHTSTSEHPSTSIIILPEAEGNARISGLTAITVGQIDEQTVFNGGLLRCYIS